MDILHLTYFVEVARQKSFTKAAQVLHVAQPSISRVIKTLENELGVTLLERAGRQIELTDAGQAVYNRAQAIVLDMENLTTELADVVGIRLGHVIIGLPPMVGARFFPTVISRFSKRYPEIQIKLVEDGSKQIEAHVSDGSLDLGVVARPLSSDNFEEFYFVNELLQVVLDRDHPLAAAASIPLRMLRDQPFILYRDDFSLNDLIVSKCIQQGFTPWVVCQSWAVQAISVFPTSILWQAESRPGRQKRGICPFSRLWPDSREWWVPEAAD